MRGIRLKIPGSLINVNSSLQLDSFILKLISNILCPFCHAMECVMFAFLQTEYCQFMLKVNSELT